jgi:hypothetical protein
MAALQPAVLGEKDKVIRAIASLNVGAGMIRRERALHRGFCQLDRAHTVVIWDRAIHGKNDARLLGAELGMRPGRWMVRGEVHCQEDYEHEA